jgi:hypothetical protein
MNEGTLDPRVRRFLLPTPHRFSFAAEKAIIRS